MENFTVQLFLRPIFKCIAKSEQEEFFLRNLVRPCSVSGVMLFVKPFLLGGVMWIHSIPWEAGRSLESTTYEVQGLSMHMSKFLLALNSSSTTRSLNWVLQIFFFLGSDTSLFSQHCHPCLATNPPLAMGCHCSKLPHYTRGSVTTALPDWTEFVTVKEK